MRNGVRGSTFVQNLRVPRKDVAAVATMLTYLSRVHLIREHQVASLAGGSVLR